MNEDTRHRRVPARPGPLRPRQVRLLAEFCRPGSARPVNYRPARVPRPPSDDTPEEDT